MKRQETVKTLSNILQRVQKDIKELQAQADNLMATIRLVETTEHEFVTTRQKGSFGEKIADTMYEVLEELGPLHRQQILNEVKRRGVYVGAGMKTIGAYLSSDDRFENVSRGVWAAADSAEESVPASLNGHIPLDLPDRST